MKKLTLILLTLALSMSAMAWHQDKPKGATTIPDSTEAELQKQQSYNRTMAPVGEVPFKTSENATPNDIDNDTQTARNVANQSSGDAARILKTSSHVAKEGSKQPAIWLWILVGGAVVGTFAYGKKRIGQEMPEILKR